jgi:solute carrier family 25 carnitine/acylcarnitine transporter 20/29
MQEYILGNIFGITQVLIGHPFDTLKTNIQNSTNTRIFFKNPRLLYRGIKYPLLMNSIGTSFLFGNYDYFYRQTNSNMISGVLTGFISAVALTPFDYKKIQLQTNTSSNTSSNKLSTKHSSICQNKLFPEIGKSVKQIIKQYYAGFTYTLVREMISIPIYFYTYEYLTEECKINPFFAGGSAGISSWLFTYPLDTLKTRRQLYQTKSIIELTKIGNLFNGLGITLVRAFIVNSTSFYIYDLIKNKHFILQDK